MNLEWLDELFIDDIEYNPEEEYVTRKHKRKCRRRNLFKHRKRMKMNSEYNMFEVFNKGTHCTRNGRSGKERFLKSYSNSVIRSRKFDYALKCGQYRRVFDYWWNLH